MEDKTYIDYAQSKGLMVMAAFYSERTKDIWKLKVDQTDYKLRKISLMEKIKNKVIIKLGGRLNEKYTRPFIYDIPEDRIKKFYK